MLDLIAVHQHHWHAAGQPGAFSTPRRVEFHRSVVRHPDTSAVLARLTVNGHTVSALYGFIVGRTFEFYQSGTSRADSPLKRPGILSHLLLMEHLATRGIERYDLLAGATPYKIQLSTASRELTELSLQRPTPRLVWAHALRTLRATLASPRSTP
jgi:CelD/BcsL family acetyltransferase involved in cellulose biosynthesis